MAIGSAGGGTVAVRPPLSAQPYQDEVRVAPDLGLAAEKQTCWFAPIAAARPSPTASHKRTFELQLCDGVVADLPSTTVAPFKAR